MLLLAKAFILLIVLLIVRTASSYPLHVFEEELTGKNYSVNNDFYRNVDYACDVQYHFRENEGSLKVKPKRI